MDQRMVIGGIVVLLCFLMVVVFVMMRSGKDETPTSSEPSATKQSKRGSTPPPPPPQPKYKIYPDHGFTGDDILCESGVEAAACEARCDANGRCVSYTHTANNKKCCIKHGTPNYKNLPGKQITAYIKNIDGYEVKEVGDRTAGGIENLKPATLPGCKERCDQLKNCIGFNFNNNNCWIKKAEGISPTYSVNGYQFYTKKTT